MNLGRPRVRTHATQTISVDVVDGPIIHLTRGYRDPTPDPKARIRVSLLHVVYNDGDLFTAELRGTQLRADGEPFERGTSGAVNYVDDDGRLRADTPDWVRVLVEAHPWVDRGLEKAADQFTAWSQHAWNLGDSAEGSGHEVTAGWLRQWARQPLDADWSVPA